MRVKKSKFFLKYEKNQFCYKVRPSRKIAAKIQVKPILIDFRDTFLLEKFKMDGFAEKKVSQFKMSTSTTAEEIFKKLECTNEVSECLYLFFSLSIFLIILLFILLFKEPSNSFIFLSIIGFILCLWLPRQSLNINVFKYLEWVRDNVSIFLQRDKIRSIFLIIFGVCFYITRGSDLNAKVIIIFFIILMIDSITNCFRILETIPTLSSSERWQMIGEILQSKLLKFICFFSIIFGPILYGTSLLVKNPNLTNSIIYFFIFSILFYFKLFSKFKEMIFKETIMDSIDIEKIDNNIV